MNEGGKDYEYIRGIDISAGDFRGTDIHRQSSEIVIFIYNEKSYPLLA